MSWQPKSDSPPPGYEYGPGYRPGWEHILRGMLYITRGQPRTLARDALLLMARMPAPPVVRNAHHLPEQGSFVLAANHYERPGLWMAWPALLLSQIAWQRSGSDVHWLAIEEWESFSLFGLPIPRTWIHAVFARAFGVYGIIPMPSHKASPSARARSIRGAVHEIRRGAVIGLMPEGDVGATPELLEPREGVGTFVLMLAAAGAPIIPVGLFEENRRLVASFGPPVDLTAPKESGRDERDRWARDRLMSAIRDLLPEPLWGAYREQT